MNSFIAFQLKYEVMLSWLCNCAYLPSFSLVQFRIIYVVEVQHRKRLKKMFLFFLINLEPNVPLGPSVCVSRWLRSYFRELS